MNFTGFDAEDFDLFAIPDFAGRMAEIRARLKPKLTALAEDLTPRIEEIIGSPMFPHVAQHMRRRVNPPVETWVAYARVKRGYKRWTHFRVAASGNGIRVTVFVEDDADDKAPIGAHFAAHGAKLLKALGPKAPILWYTLNDEQPVAHAKLTAKALAEAGEKLQRLKTIKFQAGIPLPRAEALRLGPAEFEEWALDQVRVLKPLYLAGVSSPEG